MVIGLSNIEKNEKVCEGGINEKCISFHFSKLHGKQVPLDLVHANICGPM